MHDLSHKADQANVEKSRLWHQLQDLAGLCEETAFNIQHPDGKPPASILRMFTAKVLQFVTMYDCRETQFSEGHSLAWYANQEIDLEQTLLGNRYLCRPRGMFVVARAVWVKARSPCRWPFYGVADS
jgi:hypothetical protein